MSEVDTKALRDSAIFLRGCDYRLGDEAKELDDAADTIDRLTRELEEVKRSLESSYAANKIYVDENTELHQRLASLAQGDVPTYQFRHKQDEPDEWTDTFDISNFVGLPQYETRTLFAARPAPPSEHEGQIAAAMHYPECWDTAAYPTLHSAIIETTSWFTCSTCASEAQPATPEKVGVPNGYWQGINDAATLIERNQIAHSSTGKYFFPRRDGDIDGLFYANKIRALAPPATPEKVGVPDEKAELNIVWHLLNNTRALIQKYGYRGNDFSLCHEARRIAIDVESGAYLSAMRFIKSLATPPTTASAEVSE